MKKIISLMILIITVGCSQYSSYEDCFINEMAKMPDGLSNKGFQKNQDYFTNQVGDFCRQTFPYVYEPIN